MDRRSKYNMKIKTDSEVYILCISYYVCALLYKTNMFDRLHIVHVPGTTRSYVYVYHFSQKKKRRKDKKKKKKKVRVANPPKVYSF